MRTVLLSALFCGFGAITALLCFLPLAWVGPFIVPSTFSMDKTQYQGTVWSGGIIGLRDVESVKYTLKPLRYVTGDLPLQVDMSAPGLQAQGALARFKMEDFNLRIQVANLPLPDPRLKGLNGQITARVEMAEWDENMDCETVSGTARSDVLKQNQSLFAWTGPVLAGPLSCGDDGSFVFNLQGKDDVQIISADVSISAAGFYNSNMRVVTRDREAALVLPLFGFEEKGETSQGLEFSLVEQGRWL